MSDTVLVAIITSLGTVIGALINARAMIVSSSRQSLPTESNNEIKTKGGILVPKTINYQSVNQKRTWRMIIAGMFIGGTIGLLFSFFFIFIKNSSNSDLPQEISPTQIPIDSQTLFPLVETPTATYTFTPTSAATDTSTYISIPTSIPTTTFTVTNTFTPTPFVLFDNDIPMILISKGVFNKYDKQNKDYISVSLPDFFIDQHEVTNSQYQECVSAGICRTPFTDVDSEYENVMHFGDNGYTDFPVVLVSYYMSKTYCEWRGNGTRLPTGEEWEKAARGLLVDQTYPWGDSPPTCQLKAQDGANYFGCNTRDAFPVMSFGPNGYGLFDVSGNVHEWVNVGTPYFAMGGSWLSNESQIKVYSSVEVKAFDGYVNVGFRCARDANR